MPKKSEADRLIATINDCLTKLQSQNLEVVVLGTAGIGRLNFRAWTLDEYIDRQDGDDDGTYSTPGKALKGLGERMDHDLTLAGWHNKYTP